MSTASSISTAEIEQIIERLKGEQHRNSTWKNYYTIWRNFNQFYIKLDQKPRVWEDRITLFVGYLISKGRKSTTIRSYISAIKAVLYNIKIEICEDRYLLNSLTRACRLNNDKVLVKLPIHRDLLNMLLHTAEHYFLGEGQLYLARLYMALFSTAYYGLFRVGELTFSPHVVRVTDVHLGDNKRKILFVLCTSKTHGQGSLPQTVKIVSSRDMKQPNIGDTRVFCPYFLIKNYLQLRKNFSSPEEQFFVFRDRSEVHPQHMRSTLKRLLSLAGFDQKLYGTHSLRIGMASDMMKHGIEIETIKKIGRWKSNCVQILKKSLMFCRQCFSPGRRVVFG